MRFDNQPHYTIQRLMLKKHNQHNTKLATLKNSNICGKGKFFENSKLKIVLSVIPGEIWFR